MTLSIAENFAAAHILTEWPEAYSYDELLTAVESGCDDDVFVWQPFEDIHYADIIDHIEGLRADFLNTVTLMTEELRAAIRQGDPMTIAERLASLENQLGI